MPQRRNLESWEILDQMNQAREIALESGRVVTGAVFMGMGEPFLNYENVLISAEHLCYPVKNAIAAKAITLSTVGLVDKIDRFTQEKRPFRLSISLAAATDEKRAALVPVAARASIKSVIAAARRYAGVRNQRVNLAYVCISGVNMFEEDAQALAQVVGDLAVRLDLIEVMDTSGRYQRPSEEEMSDFRDALNVHLQQPVVRRYSGGADIDAACGTLAGRL
jgi:23S rRNA (adenine2503-C2)-methyltransferase